MKKALIFILFLLFAGLSITAADATFHGVPDPENVIPPVWYATGSAQGGEFGHAAATAGDVNGDGYADFLIGAPKHDDAQVIGGAVFVYHGGAGGPADLPDWKYGSQKRGDRFGAAAAAAGDVNNDGYDDVIVGAYRYKNGETNEGAAYLFLGSAWGLETEPAWTFESNYEGANFGYAVSSAGDVNGDTYDDVLIGARWYSFGETNEGAAFLFLGSEAGLSETPNWMFESNEAGASLGTAVAAAGDINGDSFADILIGAPQAEGAQGDVGKVYVFYGSATGPAALPDWEGEGDGIASSFGEAVGSAGDVNGDGFSDVFVGAPKYVQNAEAGLFNGAVYVYYGSEDGLSQIAQWRIVGDQEGAELGISGGTAGDINDDGFDDLIVGAYRFDDDQLDEGCISIYMGGIHALSTLPAWTACGDKADTWFGFAAHTAGDINGDGFADMIVGAPFYRQSEILFGRTFLYLGTPVVPAGPFEMYLPVLGKE